MRYAYSSCLLTGLFGKNYYYYETMLEFSFYFKIRCGCISVFISLLFSLCTQKRRFTVHFDPIAFLPWWVWCFRMLFTKYFQSVEFSIVRFTSRKQKLNLVFTELIKVNRCHLRAFTQTTYMSLLKGMINHY